METVKHSESTNNNSYRQRKSWITFMIPAKENMPSFHCLLNCLFFLAMVHSLTFSPLSFPIKIPCFIFFLFPLCGRWSLGKPDSLGTHHACLALQGTQGEPQICHRKVILSFNSIFHEIFVAPLCSRS